MNIYTSSDRLADFRGVPEDQVETLIMAERIKMFFNSDVGVYILNSMSVERAEAIEQLVKVKPNDVFTIREIQNSIKIIDSIQGYFSELLIKAAQIEIFEKNGDNN